MAQLQPPNDARQTENEGQAKSARKLMRVCQGFALLALLFALAGAAWASSEKSALPWSVGQELVPGWRITEVRSDTEFARFRLKGDKGEHVVEIAYNPGFAGEWATASYRLQPAPKETPPIELLRAVMNKLREHEASANAKPFVKQRINPGQIPAAKFLLMPLFPWLLVGVAFLVLLFFLRKRLESARDALNRFGLERLLSYVAKPLRALNFGLLHEESTLGVKHWLWALGLAGAAFAYLMHLNLQAPIWTDSQRELLLARDCLAGYGCRFHGSMSSFAGLCQGALWIHFLVICEWLGLSIGGIQTLLLAFHALAVGLLYLTCVRFLSPRYALTSAVLFLLTTRFVMNVPVLWNLALAPLPLVAFAASLLNFTRRGSAPWAIISAFFLAFCIDSHFIMILLVPAYFFVLSGFAPNHRAWVAGFFALFTTLGLVSFEAHLINLGVFVEKGYWLPFGASLLAAIVLGWFVRPRLCAKAEPLSAEILNGLLLYSLACFCLLQTQLPNWSMNGDSRYWLPAILWVCVFGGRALYVLSVPPGREFSASRLGRLAGFALSLCLIFGCVCIFAPLWLVSITCGLALFALGRFGVSRLLAFPSWLPKNGFDLALAYALLLFSLFAFAPFQEPSIFSLNQVEEVSARLYDKGCRYEELQQRLRGPLLHDVLSSVGIFEPNRPLGCPKQKGELQVSKLLAEEAPASWPPALTHVAFPDGTIGVIEPLDSWLDFRHLRLCFTALDSKAPYSRCVDDGVEAIAQNEESGGEAFGNSFGVLPTRIQRFIPSFQAARDEALTHPAKRWRVDCSLRVAPQGEDETRRVVVSESSALRSAATISWHITTLQGVEALGQIAPLQIEIGRKGEAEGLLTFSTNITAEQLKFDPLYPPEFLEIRPQYERVYGVLAPKNEKRPFTD